MKTYLSLAVMALVFAGSANARDTVVNVSLAEVLAMPEAQGRLDSSVTFFPAGQAVPKKVQRMESDVANEKTSGVGKSDEAACKWAVLSALIKFQASAKRHGANAVVDMVGYYKKIEGKNDGTVECHAGNIMTGVAIKGTYAKLP